MNIFYDLEVLEKIIKIMKDNNLGELSIENDEAKVCIKEKVQGQIPPMPPMNMNLMTTSGNGAETVTKTVNGSMIKSPIIGTFYAAPAPDKPAFVKVGDKVEKGQVICIVESMKLMNEIVSEFSGTVSEIFVKDGSAVEYDQEIMLIV